MPKDTTISVNGGPEVPLDTAMQALDQLNDERAKQVMLAIDLHDSSRKCIGHQIQQLMCRMTDDEQRVRGVDLADAEKDLAEYTEDRRATGDLIKKCQAKIDKLAEAVKHKQEERPVECGMTPDYEKDTMTIYRTDTMNVVSVRQLKHSERQPELPIEEENGQDTEGQYA